MEKLRWIKVLGIIVAVLGIAGFAEPKFAWVVLPITISIGALIFSLAIMTEIIVNVIRHKNEKETDEKDESSLKD